MVNSFNDSANTRADSESRQETNPKVAKELDFDSLKNSLRDEPEINAARVLYFKAEIASGNYQINSNTIAAKMVHKTELA